MGTYLRELSASARSGLVYDQPTMTADRFYPSPMTPERPSGVTPSTGLRLRTEPAEVAGPVGAKGTAA